MRLFFQFRLYHFFLLLLQRLWSVHNYLWKRNFYSFIVKGNFNLFGALRLLPIVY
jgi:hypothetical protein